LDPLLPLLLGYNILPLPHPYLDPLLPSYLDTISSHSLILTWIRYCPSYLETISSLSLILTWISYCTLAPSPNYVRYNIQSLPVITWRKYRNIPFPYCICIHLQY
jgi:hypothetical protein